MNGQIVDITHRAVAKVSSEEPNTAVIYEACDREAIVKEFLYSLTTTQPESHSHEVTFNTQHHSCSVCCQRGVLDTCGLLSHTMKRNLHRRLIMCRVT